MAAVVDLIIAFDEPDKDGWIVARFSRCPKPGLHPRRAPENISIALRTILTPGEDLAGEAPTRIESTCCTAA